MADKTTTLKTQTGDNVYPNIKGENRKDYFADSSTIKHYYYAVTHKVGFQLANETNNKIANSLQKPAGLTKTELVGVGTNGQENIEIGDNLTLENGKLSASGGGSGGDAFDVINTSDGTTYTGNITGTKPVILNLLNSAYYSGGTDVSQKLAFFTFFIDNGDTVSIINFKAQGGKIEQERIDLPKYTPSDYYSHFITLTSDNDKIYLQYYNIANDSLDIDGLKEALSGKKVICTGVLGNSDETLATPLYVSGEAGGLEVYYVLKNDTSGTISNKSITAFAISDLVSPVE